MDKLHQGQFIVVRASGNKMLVRRLWTWNHLVTFVHNEKQFALRVNNQDYYDPIPFSWSDSFSLPEGAQICEIEGRDFGSLDLVPLSAIFRMDNLVA